MKKFAKITALILVVVMGVVALSACGVPKTAEDADAQMKELGYTSVAGTASDLIDGISGLFGASISTDVTVRDYSKKVDDSTISLVATWYANKDDATEAYEDMKESKEKSLAELKADYEAEKITKDEYEDGKDKINATKFGKSGVCVYAGDKEAVKDFRGF